MTDARNDEILPTIPGTLIEFHQPENMTDLLSGRVGYNEYGRHTGWQTFDGRTMPQWDELPTRTQDAWRAATHRIIDESTREDVEHLTKVASRVSDDTDVMREQLKWLCENVEDLLNFAGSNPMFKLALAKIRKDRRKRGESTDGE